MSETYGCSNCGEDTENEPFSLCDECKKPARPESIAALETQRDELAEALRAGIRSDLESGPCWCFCAAEHHEKPTELCRKARAALAKVKG